MAIQKKRSNLFRKLLIVFFIILIIVISFLIFYYKPQKVVELIGVRNSYIIAFISGLLGGVSILFPFPYYLLVFSFGAGGLNPILLGLVAGFGVILGESTSYLVGYHGREILPNRIQALFNKIGAWSSNKSNSIYISIFLFLYGAFIPLPNDVIILSLAAAKYNYWKLIIPLGLGNIIFNIMVAYFGLYGLKLFF